MRTEMGKIAGLLAGAGTTQTPLQRQLENVGRTLLVLCLGIVAVVSVVGLRAGHGLARGVPVRGSAGRGRGARGAPRDRDHRPGPGRAAYGDAARHRATAGLRRDPGLHHGHLHRQDGDPHHGTHGGEGPVGDRSTGAAARRRRLQRRGAGRSRDERRRGPDRDRSPARRGPAGHPAGRHRARCAAPRRGALRLDAQADVDPARGRGPLRQGRARERAAALHIGNRGCQGRQPGDGRARPARPGRGRGQERGRSRPHPAGAGRDRGPAPARGHRGHRAGAPGGHSDGDDHGRPSGHGPGHRARDGDRARRRGSGPGPARPGHGRGEDRDRPRAQASRARSWP